MGMNSAPMNNTTGLSTNSTAGVNLNNINSNNTTTSTVANNGTSSTAPERNPEMIPVGLMATMLKSLGRRGMQRDFFVPYKPIDPSFTPLTLPPMEVPTPRLLERVEDFYADLKDDDM